MRDKRIKRYRRHKRVRAKIKGTAKVPRFCIFRSSKHIYGQLINDEKGKTIVSASDLELKPADIKKILIEARKNKKTATAKPQKKEQKHKKDLAVARKTLIAHVVGQLIAKKATEKKIKKVVFDRGGYKYHGRVKALAEGAREAGLKF